MGRIYTVSVEQVAVSVAQDFFELTCPATSMVEILSAFLGQHSDAGDAQAELLPVQWTRYATSGSGGTVPTPRPHNVGHGASGVTAEANNDIQGGTPTVVHAEVFNVQAGWLYQPVPEERIWIPPSGILAVELPVAPADALTMTGRITFVEHD